MASLGAVAVPPQARRTQRLVAATLVLAAGGLGAIAVQAIAVRVLPAAEVGVLVLALGIVSVGAAIAGAGVPQLIARVASEPSESLPSRTAVAAAAAIVSIPLACVLVAITAVMYRDLRPLGLMGALLLGALIVTRQMQYVESSFRRASNRTATGAFVHQGSLLLLAAVFGLLVEAGIDPSVPDLLAVLAGVQAILVAASLGSRLRTLFDGVIVELRRLWTRRHLLAPLWGSSVVALLFVWVDRFAIAAVDSTEAVAQYQSLVLLTAAFDVVALAVGYIQLPHYVRAGRWRLRSIRLALGAATVCAAASAIAIIAFGGRLFLIEWSASAAVTIVVLGAVGVLKVVYADVSAALGALASPQRLRSFTLQSILVFGFGTPLVFAAAAANGAVAVAAVLLVLWACRLATAVRLCNAKVT